MITSLKKKKKLTSEIEYTNPLKGTIYIYNNEVPVVYKELQLITQSKFEGRDDVEVKVKMKMKMKIHREEKKVLLMTHIPTGKYSLILIIFSIL